MSSKFACNEVQNYIQCFNLSVTKPIFPHYMYCTYFQSISLEGSCGFSSHLRLGFSLWEVKDRWHSVWLQVNYFVSTFFGYRWCIENWSSVKCLAHYLEVFEATNPSRQRLCTQIRLNFGSFGKRYIATPFCDRMLQLNAAH